MMIAAGNSFCIFREACLYLNIYLTHCFKCSALSSTCNCYEEQTSYTHFLKQISLLMAGRGVFPLEVCRSTKSQESSDKPSYHIPVLLNWVIIIIPWTLLAWPQYHFFLQLYVVQNGAPHLNLPSSPHTIWLIPRKNSKPCIHTGSKDPSCT